MTGAIVKTYILGDTEVKLTGRCAERSTGSRTQKLVEVTPACEDNGTWKKFVPMATLFEVKDRCE